MRIKERDSSLISMLLHVIFKNDSWIEVIAGETTNVAPVVEITPDSTVEEAQVLEGQQAEEAATAAETEQRKMFKYM